MRQCWLYALIEVSKITNLCAENASFVGKFMFQEWRISSFCHSHQQFQHLGLRSVMIVLLLEAQSLELLNQADVLGKPAPSNQKGMLSVLYVLFAVVHDRSLLRWEWS
jgi:hypothetical protein